MKSYQSLIYRTLFSGLLLVSMSFSASRIDYVYVTKDLGPRVTTSKILKDPFTQRFSDHLPVLVELQ